jgi:hypothetical protein
VDWAADSYSIEYTFVWIRLMIVTVLNMCVDWATDSYGIECEFLWIKLLTVTVLNVFVCVD